MIRFGTTRKAPTEDEAGWGKGKTMAVSPKGYVRMEYGWIYCEKASCMKKTCLTKVMYNVYIV